MKTISKTLLLALCVVAVPVVTLAAKPGKKSKEGPVEAYFTKHDTNKDGYISPAEFGGDPAEFAKWDTDRNGKLDHNEVAAMLAAQKAK